MMKKYLQIAQILSLCFFGITTNNGFSRWECSCPDGRSVTSGQIGFKGNKGLKGGSGGDAGDIEIVAIDTENFIYDFEREVGQGSNGGPGGFGGLGSAGGKCGNKCCRKNDLSNARGEKGEGGDLGDEGLLGSLCLTFSDEERNCSNK